MVGRTPANIVAIRPLKDGVIADFEIVESMLRYFINRVHEEVALLPRPRVVVGIPSGVTEVERRAVSDAAVNAGAREAYLIEEPMAAAIGADLPITEPSGSMIVDIGGGTTEVAVISLGGIVLSKSVRVAGDEIDEMILQFARREHGLLIGERTAEQTKLTAGSAHDDVKEIKVILRGRDVVTGLPKSVEVSSKDIREAIEPPRGPHHRSGYHHHRGNSAGVDRRHHGSGHNACRRRRAAAGARSANCGGNEDAGNHRRGSSHLCRQGNRTVPGGSGYAQKSLCLATGRESSAIVKSGDHGRNA